MRHWDQLDTAPIPGSDKTLMLFKDKDDFHIKISGGIELMNTRQHGSEDALGYLPCQALKNPEAPQILIGGLGMGFTLASVLAHVGSQAVVDVAELIPEVVEWNLGPLGAISEYPLNDIRTRVHITDVGKILRARKACYDVIALDVDNGPDGLTTTSNDWLYTAAGIHCVRTALKPKGIVSYWSAVTDPKFNKLLKSCNLRVEEKQVYAHGKNGARHTIWLAYKDQP
jgi:spermidine synthase